MRTRNGFLHCLVFLIALLTAAPAYATTYYVAPTGDDVNGDGSSTKPMKSIQYGCALLKAGDTLNIRAGIYEGIGVGIEAGRFSALNGTAALPITIQIDPTAAPGSVIINDGSRDPYCVEIMDCHFLTIKGLTIKAGQNGATSDGIRIVHWNSTCSDINILNCDVSGSLRFGVFVSGSSNVRIEGCNLHDNPGAGDATTGHNMYLTGGTLNAIVRGNIIARAGSQGAHLNADGGAVSGCLFENNVLVDNVNNGLNMDGVTKGIFRNNLIVGSTKHGVSMYRIDGTTGCTGNVFSNNTIVSPASSGAAVQMTTKSTGNSFLNNILIGGAQGSFVISTDSVTGFVSDYNVVGDHFENATGVIYTFAQWKAKYPTLDVHSLVAAPGQLFVSTTDYHLVSGSPASGKGSTGGDIGYAYTTTTPVPPPTPTPTPDPTIAQLQAQVATLTTQLAAAQADAAAKAATLSTLQAKISAAQTAAQATVDALK